MPCAGGELCAHSVTTPHAPDGVDCQGSCGGRLHGTCGEADSGNGDAAFPLQPAKMAMIAAHASNPARQTDIYEGIHLRGGVQQCQSS